MWTTPFLRYGVPVLVTGLALLPARVLGAVPQEGVFLLLLAAVVVSASSGGMGPGLLATFLGALAGASSSVLVAHPLTGAATPATMQLGAFVVLATMVSWLSGKRHTAQQRASAACAEVEVAQRHCAFLAEAGAVLASSLDYETTLASLARLAVPDLAHWCVVDVVEEDGAIRRLAVTHVDPARDELANALQRYPPEPGVPAGVAKVLCTGQPELVPEVSEAWLAAAAPDAEHLAILRQLGLCSAMIVPLQARGRTLGAISFVRALPGRRYEPTDLWLAGELARRAALAVDNARLYHQAQAAIRARNEFLSSVSHDLKNPLATIKGHAQFLKRRVSRAGAPDAGRVLEGLVSIDATATKMAAMIDELLDVARLQIGQPLALDRRPTDLAALAQQVAAEYQRTTEHHCIRVEAAAPQLVGLWDAARLDRVLGNLLSNAVKYSPQGGDIAIRVAQEEGANGRWAILQVQDRGVGIPVADQPHVFDRFYRGKNVAG